MRTELGKKTFKFAASSAWNNPQNNLKLKELVSLDVFNVILNDLEAETLGCRCFVWFSYVLVIFIVILFLFDRCYLLDLREFCVTDSLGQDALEEIFNLNVLFLVK